MTLVAVQTTVATQEDARRIARALVERGLVACAQIHPIESFYVWRGAVRDEPEWRILGKTVAHRYGAVEAAIRELHPYEVPEVLATRVEQVWGPYAAWVEAGSSGAE